MNENTEVKLHFLDYWRVIKVRWYIVLLAFLLVVISAGITVMFLPREYFSKVTMEIKPDNTVGVEIFGGSTALRGGSDMRFTPTQFQIVQSKEILYPVIRRLKLDERWGGAQRLPLEQAYIRLRGAMQMQEVRNTDLIEIGMFSGDPQEAADIANTVAEEYQDRRRRDANQLISRGLAQLEDEVAKQRQKVEDAAAEAARIRVREGIVDLNPETMDGVGTTENRQVLSDEERLDEAQAMVTKLQTQLEQIKPLRPEELMVALRTLEIEDPTVSQILPQYQQAVAEEATMLNSGLGENHPKVKALRATREVQGQQLRDAITALRTNLETRLRIARETVAALERRLDTSRGGLQEAKAQSADYIEAKTRYLQAKDILKAAEMRLHTEKMQANISFVPAKIWERAEPAIVPARPNVPAYMALAVLSGLVVGVGLAFFIEYLDTSVKTVDDVESFLGVPVLGVIRKGVGLLHQIKGNSPDAEAYRTIRANIEFNRKNPEANTITVVSSGPGEGKSTTLCNMAIVCAQGGYRVLIIDTDLRRPRQHEFFNIENATGLTNHLMGEVSLDEVIHATPVENLYVIPSGILPTDAVGILSSQRMSELIARVKGGFDLVFFDSPPILGVSDATVLAKEVDMTLMVIQHRRFPRSMLLRVKQSIANVGGNLLGVVLNNVDTKHDDAYRYYTNYYDYYYYYYTPRKQEERPVPATPAARPDPDGEY